MVDIIEAFGELSDSHLIAIIIIFFIIFNASITIKHKKHKDDERNNT